MNEPTGVAADAATILFKLPDYRVIHTAINAGWPQVIVETDSPPRRGGRNDDCSG